MSSRTIDNPGVELNEIDRSGYEKIDNSLPNSPISYVTGFADKGQNMTIEWIDSFATFTDTFGVPTTEFEMYMYNAVAEILNRGGSCIASRLPYDNNQLDKYNYVQYDINQFVKIIDDSDFQTIGDIHDRLAEIISNIPSMSEIQLDTINQMAYAIAQLTKEGVDLTTINSLATSLADYIRNNITDKFALLYFNDSSLTSYIEVKAQQSASGEYGAIDSLQNLDDLITSHKSVLPGTMRIYDITRAKYDSVANYNCVSSDALSSWTNECLGIVPVVVTPANAMYFQNVLSLNKHASSVIDFTAFNCVSAYATQHHDGVWQDFSSINDNVSLPIASTTTLSDMSIIDVDSVSRMAAAQFPPVNFYTASTFDKENLKKIGIVVFNTFRDTSNGGKIGFQLLESFVGSFDRNAKDPVTHSSLFIDNVVNQNSQFIRVFSKINPYLMQQASTFATSCQPAVAMGFYKEDCAKDISFIKSIMNPLTNLLDTAANTNHVPIDIVVDAGVSNIAQLAKMSDVAQTGMLPPSVKDLTKLHTDYIPNVGDYNWAFNKTYHDITGWKAVLSKFDNFCKGVRKDCMFIADGLRPVCLDGNSKIVRPTAPGNTVANSIIPQFRYIAHAIDSSYSAGYCNWFYQQSYGMSDYFWCPPSIKAMGVYIYCDTYFHPWSAPAGTTRGVIGDAVDVAFLPTDADAGVIYSNSWNYAMSYPIDGIVIEGHKTFQTQRTALDRVNVRRLMLSLENQVANVARTFVYEQNNAYTRQQFVDRITPILDNAVAGSGISEYAVKCDEELNTTQVIENNEMRCKIAVRPVKTVDYLVINFIATNQSVSISEEIAR